MIDWGRAVVDDDPYLWLETIDSEQAVEWVAQHNGPTLSRLSGERFEQMRASVLDILDSDDRIPAVSREGEYLYNLWRDASHPRGVWRRTTLEEYRKDSPGWDVVIDIDALALAEDENWVWDGASINAPSYKRALVFLTRGGGDADVVREFDMITRQFVADGFNLPEAKTVLADRFRVPPADQAVAARNPTGRGRNGLLWFGERRLGGRGVRAISRL